MRKYTLFRLLVFAAFLVIGCIGVYELDRNNYQARKWEFMLANQLQFMDLERYRVVDQAVQLLQANERDEARQLDNLELVMERCLDELPALVALDLQDGEQNSIVRRFDQAKMRRNNRFPDGLLLRNFSKNNITPLRRDAIRPDRNRRLVATWTTPPKDPYIQSLTYRYAVYAALIMFGSLAVFLLIDRFFMRPYDQVMSHIQAATDTPRLIRPAHGELERSYNLLAREAIIREIEQHFQDPRLRLQSTDGFDILRDLPGLAIARLGYRWAVLMAVRREESMQPGGGASWILSHAVYAGALEPGAAADASHPLPRRLLQEGMTQEILRQASLGRARASAVYLQRGGNSLPETAVGTPLHDPTPGAPSLVLMAGLPPATLANEAGEEAVTLARLAERMDSQLAALALQRQDIARERNEANVSLARNLGHDLTNIIATSKLDLLMLQRLGTRLTPGIPAPARDLGLMRETLANLLNTSRFMQEIVDIYRSFSYLKRPTYESVDLATLLRDLLGLFEMSTSRRLSVVLEASGSQPPAVVEPRLIKLAIFNLLNNSLEALREASVADPSREGRIRVSLAARNQADAVEIVVEDNGPGIRGADGEPLVPEELDRIFSLGYTTKKRGEGEGLGLNWVRTIVCDFHAGSIQVENVPSGGARFIIRLDASEKATGHSLL